MTPGKMYMVAYVDGEMLCNCGAFEYGMTDPCKHILSVVLIEVA